MNGRGRQARGPRREYLRVAGGKVGGVIEYRPEGAVLRKVVAGAGHQLRLPKAAWAIDSRILEAAAAAGVGWVEIFDKSTGDLWWARLADFQEHGERLDRGFGEQTALDLNWFSFVPADSITARQATLFAEAAR